MDPLLQRLLDAESIRHLKHRYCALCEADYDADGLAALFTEDAAWDGGPHGRAPRARSYSPFF